MVNWIDHEAVNRAHELAARDALLEHARMGRSVCEGRDGKVVWFTPAEIFARYGFDEFGRPLPASGPGA
jgi:GGDEF domain-containing protein